MISNKPAMLMLLLLIGFLSFANAISKPETLGTTREAPITVSVTPAEIFNQASIDITVGATDTYSVYIESNDGILIKTLYYGTLSIGAHQFNWDRVTNSGSRADSGSCRLAVLRVGKDGTIRTLILR